MNKKPILIILLLAGMNCYAQNIFKKADSIRIKDEIPEMAYAVITPDKIIDEQYLGYHKIGEFTTKDTARKTDYFHLGSNTKAITGFIAAYIVENHKIKWSTKIFDLFPQWKNFADSTYYKVTLQDLLSHRARIQPYTSALEYQELPNFKGSRAKQREQFAAYLLREKPVAVKENVIYNYSNAGYSIAAAMLEKATGSTWEQLVEDVMNAKLHLNVRFGWPNKSSTDEPWGHWVENNKLTPVPGTTSYNLNLAEPAGDISMTLPDYIKLTQLHLIGLSGTDNILKSDTYNFLHYGLKGYAIGWGNNIKGDIKLSDHSGSAGTYYCYALFDGVKNKAYVIMINSATDKAQKGLFELLAILRKQ
jgi:CubicO group peptidase (beta-lactamase class C family)